MLSILLYPIALLLTGIISLIPDSLTFVSVSTFSSMLSNLDGGIQFTLQFLKYFVDVPTLIQCLYYLYWFFWFVALPAHFTMFLIKLVRG